MPILSRTMRRALAALNVRDFRLFYLALVTAALGSQIQTTANLWLIYELTNSPLHLGFIGLARGLPILGFSLLGGILADRLDRRRFIMVTQAVTGLSSLSLTLLTGTGLIQVWHIYLATFISSSMTALYAPARTAMIASLVPKEHLLNAFSLNSTVWQMSHLIGPALSGVSISFLGAPATYAMDGLAQLATLTSLTAMRPVPTVRQARQPIVRSLIEGLRFVRSQRIILVLLAMDSAATFFGSYRALLPVVARRLGAGPEGLGLLFSAPAAGALLGAATILALGNVRYKGLVVVGAILAYSACLGTLAMSSWLVLSLLATAGLGFFDSLQTIPRNAVIQLRTPDELRGRVSSFQRMITNGVPALGQVQSGTMAALLGAPLALAAGATVCAALILSMLATRRELRDGSL